MNKFESVTKPLRWFIALLMVALVAGCGGSSDSTPIVSPGDTVAPTVTTTAPSNAATDIALNANVTATFSELMDAATISSPSATFTLAQSGTPVAGVVTYSGMTAVFNPTGDLTASVPYTATVSTGAKDVAGNALAAAKVWSFTSGAAADIVAPTVISTAPADADTGVALNADIIASFDELMDATTVTDLSFILAQSGTPVAGVVSYLGTSATFNPTSDLAASSVYTATVLSGASGVADLAGNPLAVDKVWSFTTGAASAVSTTCTGAGVTCVPLGLADDFSILAQTMITDATVSSITGNIGVSAAAGSTITVPCASMLTGKVYDVDGTYTGGASCSMPGPGANKTTVDTAVANMGTAYTDAATRVSPAPVNELGAGDISGMTLAPGIYKWTTPVLIYAGNPNNILGGDTTGVTLDCTAGGSTSVFIFQISGSLTEGLTATPAQINLTGGCLASNIFWQATNDVTITPASVFNGNILTATQVVMQAGAVLHGRALAQTAVTLIQNTVGP